MTLAKQVVLVLDFGSQYTQLIARRVREQNVYSEIHPFDFPLDKIRAMRPAGIVLSGGPSSVYDQGAPRITDELFGLGIPILGICYGVQLTSLLLGGKVVSATHREYGRATVRLETASELFHGFSASEDLAVWMSHGDRVESLPEGFACVGTSANCPFAAVEAPGRKFWGVQFHPEVAHTPRGMEILGNFLFRICGCQPTWTMANFVEEAVAQVKRQAPSGRVICGLSGGVDSSVAASLVHRAVGDRLTCIFVDNGLLRKGQYETLMEEFRRKLRLRVVGVDAADFFLRRLRGVTSPERKRKIIGRAFIEIFDREARRLGGAAFLAQGTIYPDVIESAPVKGPSATIKSHHNVGGLPKGLKFRLVEPLRELFKDEVRALAAELGVDREFIAQHPFPGPGLAVRILGDVTPERLAILREADRILLEEVRRHGAYNRLWQAFAVLLPVRSVGVMGDQRTYQQVVVLRLVQSVDGMTANWYPAEPGFLSRVSTRIVNEVDGVNRVVYDITTKPPATIEWE
jgi:GMP synthase (glutamine-hydrolysing)